jgi:hypothetical protein
VTLTAPPQGGSEKPKRPVSAMFIFSEEKRRQLQEERPELSESELTRLLARMWNDLSEKKKVRLASESLGHQCPQRGSQGHVSLPVAKWPRPCPCPCSVWPTHVPGPDAGLEPSAGRREAVSEGCWLPGELVGRAERGGDICAHASAGPTLPARAERLLLSGLGAPPGGGQQA